MAHNNKSPQINSSQDHTQKPGIPHFALMLVSPLVLALIFFTLPEYSPIAPLKLQIVFLGYCVGLLSFFAGTRYGIYLNQKRPGNAWILPLIMGPFLGLFVLLLPFSLGLAILIAGFGAHGAWDSWGSFHGRLPDDYSASRMVATWIICAILICVFILTGIQ